MTSATDELRRLLDERGVEWKAPASYDGSTKYDTIVDGYWFHEYDGRITVHGLTLEQAIAATLGPVTCRYEWSLADNGWADYICSACGYVKNTDVHVSLGWSYCPNCGCRIVEVGK